MRVATETPQQSYLTILPQERTSSALMQPINEAGIINSADLPCSRIRLRWSQAREFVWLFCSFTQHREIAGTTRCVVFFLIWFECWQLHVWFTFWILRAFHSCIWLCNFHGVWLWSMKYLSVLRRDFSGKLVAVCVLFSGDFEGIWAVRGMRCQILTTFTV